MIDNNRTSTIRNTTPSRTATKPTFNTTRATSNTSKSSNPYEGLVRSEPSNVPYTTDRLSVIYKDIKNLIETTSVDTIASIEENINSKIDDLYNKIDEDRRKDLDYMRNYILSSMGVGLAAIGLMDMIMFILLILFN